ncbi:MAG: hypothetical protein ACHQAY_28365 [Hyphomicrobiales bacterium]
MLRRFHLAAAVTATVTILAFWATTMVVELLGTTATIAGAKLAILWGMLVLVPAMAATGASGFRLGSKRRNPIVATKKRRMALVAGNGLLVLVPSAIFLAGRSATGTFDGWFYAVQTIELVAGATNLALMSLNLRDGLRLSGGVRLGGAAAQ